MHNSQEQAWDRDDLFEEITQQNVEDFRADRQIGVVEITLRHSDLSEGLSFGHIYVRGSVESVLEAIGESVSALIGCVEIGVPDARRSALPPNRVRRSISGALVAVARMVRGCEIG